MANELQSVLDEIKLEKDTKLLPENIKKGISLLGVEGNLKEKVKLFETIDEMQTDSTPGEGDLALVYRNEISNATVDSQFSSIKFPATVVLPAAITEDDYISTSFRSVDSDVWLDCWCSLEYTSFRASIYADDMNLSITYTSEDGMTYTRTDTEAEIIDLPGEVYCEYTNEWNDYIGYFVLVNGYTFDGLFQYSGKTHKNIVNFISTSDITVGSGEVTITRTADNIQTIDIDLLFSNNVIPRQVRIRFGTKDGKLTAVFAKKTDGTYSDIDHDSGSIQCDDAGTTFYDKPQYSADSLIMRVIEADNSTYTDYELEKVTFGSGSIFRYRLDTDTLPSFILYENNYQFDTVNNIGKWNSGAEVFQNNYFSMPDDYYPIINAYYYADTQLNIKSSNQLLPGKKAYGNNGVIIGDGSVYENLDTTLINTNLLKVKLGNDSDGDSTAQLCGEHINSTQNMISYSADTNGVNYVYYNDDEHTMPNFYLSVKITEDTIIGVTYNSTNKILTASKYEFSTITDSDLKNFDSTYNSIGLDATKENIYISARYYNSGYYLNCYKINLVDNTFVKMCSHFNKSSSELDYTNASIISPEQQAVFVDCKAGIKKFSFDGTSSVVKTKSGAVANYMNRAAHLHSYRYLQVLMETDGDYILYDTVTDTLLTETAHEYSYRNDTLFEVNGKTYFHVGLTRCVVCYRKRSN